MHATHLRRMAGWTRQVQSYDTAEEAESERLRLDRLLCRDDCPLPPGWSVRVYPADDDLFCLGVYGPGEGEGEALLVLL